MAILALVIIGVGVLLILIGTWISLSEWKAEQERRAREKARDGAAPEAAPLGEALEGLAKLAEALKNHKLGMQLIIVGIALITLGGILSGVTCLADAARHASV